MSMLGKVVIMKLWFCFFGLALLMQLGVNIFLQISLIMNSLLFFVLLGITNVICVFIKRYKYKNTQTFAAW